MREGEAWSILSVTTTIGAEKSEADLLKVSNLSVNYALEETQVDALKNVNLNLRNSLEGGLGIVGESGSGKTTLGLSVLKLIESPGRITSGSVEYMGKNILEMSERELRKYRWEQVSMVYQSAMNSLNPVRTIVDPIVEVLRSHARMPKHQAERRAVELLSEVGIKPERAYSYPHELSGGMRQRVVIALALALSPKILIADEPTSALDVLTQRQILALLRKEIRERGLYLIFITHEISLLNGLVDNIAVMYAGEIVEKGPVRDILSNPKHPYTEMLLNTLLTLQSKRSVSLTRTDAAETPSAFPTQGCRYSNRCKYVFDRCRVEEPLLRKTKDQREVSCHKYN